MLTFKEYQDIYTIFESIDDAFGFITEDDHKQPWGHFKHNKGSDKSEHEQAHEFYHKHVKPHLDKSHHELKRLLHHAKTHDAKVITHTKSPESFVDKVVNRKKSAHHIDDVSRGAILTRTHKEADQVVHNLKKKGHVVKHEHKTIGTSEGGYHGAHHVTVSAGGVHHEVQVMPKKVWTAKQESHKSYAKHRGSGEDSSDRQKDNTHTKKLFRRAVIRSEDFIENEISIID